MRICTLVVAALALPVVAAASPTLVGTWIAHVEGETYIMVLKADGTGMLLDQAIRYETENNIFQAFVDGNRITYVFDLEGDRLTLSDGGTAPILFTRTSSSMAPSPPSDNAPGDRQLTGKWRDPNGAIIELRADGTGANAQGEFHYQARDGYLYLAEFQLLLRYELDGSHLVVTGQDGSLKFEKASEHDLIGVGSPDRQADGIVVNGMKLTATQIAKFEQKFRIRMLKGNYWYDSKCGAWGAEGGPTLGFLPAGLDLGGPLSPSASGGSPTGVFINGRQLHPVDVAALQQITPVVPGRFWVDSNGNCGLEGSPVPLVNLVQLSRAAQSRSGSYHSRSDITGIGSGGDGKTSYVMGKDWSVIIGE